MSNLRHLTLDQLVIVRDECLRYIEILRLNTKKCGEVGGQLERLEWIDHYIKERKFELGLKEVYNDLSNGQEPLGEEFEKIWDENVDNLYEE